MIRPLLLARPLRDVAVPEKPRQWPTLRPASYPRRRLYAYVGYHARTLTPRVHWGRKSTILATFAPHWIPSGKPRWCFYPFWIPKWFFPNMDSCIPYGSPIWSFVQYRFPITIWNSNIVVYPKMVPPSGFLFHLP